MEDVGDILKLVEAARLYYEDDLTQSEIAERLKVSRPLVSKMLQRAKEVGIVNIDIRSPLSGNESLLGKMKTRFDLEDGLIVPSNKGNDDLSQKNLISQAVVYIQKTLASAENIGLGWGATISELVEGFSGEGPVFEKPATLCPLIGSMESPSKGLHTNELTRRLCERIGGNALYLHAPAFTGSKKNWMIFQTTDEYLAIQKIWERLDTAILSVEDYPSVPDEGTAFRFGTKLKDCNAIGVMLAYYFDNQGSIVIGENDFSIRIPFDALSKVRRIVLIAPGSVHALTLLGALRTGIVTHLITDDSLARQLLEF